MKEETLKSILIYTGAVILIAFALSPFIWMVVLSFAGNATFLFNGDYGFTFNNYVRIITEQQYHFPEYMRNSLIVSIVVSIFVTIFSSFAGYAVSRMRFPGRVAIPLLVLAMSMFPQISIVGYIKTVFSGWGWDNQLIALILPYIAWTIPVALWINMSYFGQIPIDLDKAALVDGASRTKTLFQVILPIALPGIFSSFLLVFIACFNEYLFALMLTSSAQAQTLPVGIGNYAGSFGQIDYGLTMAASVIASLPLVIITLIFQRYIVQGLAGGAVKG